MIWKLMLKPWVIAAGGSVAAYYMAKKNRETGERLKEAKLELIEQQRTIDRLRAEVGRERHLRREESDVAY